MLLIFFSRVLAFVYCDTVHTVTRTEGYSGRIPIKPGPELGPATQKCLSRVRLFFFFFFSFFSFSFHFWQSEPFKTFRRPCLEWKCAISTPRIVFAKNEIYGFAVFAVDLPCRNGLTPKNHSIGSGVRGRGAARYKEAVDTENSYPEDI